MGAYEEIMILFILLFTIQMAYSQPEFEQWFDSGRMRVDYVLAGNDTLSFVYLSQVLVENSWSGSKEQLLDSMFYCDYYFTVRDSATDILLFSRGFNTLFGEWQTTAEAKTERKAFKQSLVFPNPLKTVRLEIFRFTRYNERECLYNTFINPTDILIKREEKPSFETRDVFISGPAEKKVDLLLIAEGYQKSEMKKFQKDVKRFVSILFSVEPYKSNQDKFNIRAVLSPSIESGTDVPGQKILRNTILNSSYYTFGVERYLTTEDYWALMDVAANSIWDHLIVLVNTSRYGGGGIFNYYAICTADNRRSAKVFVHEFGHSFGALGDEYYSSSVAYTDYFPLDEEPRVPNLTSLVDFESKWKNLVDEDIPVPTPADPQYEGRTGVFEGGGYVAKGIYRPAINCRMKSNDVHDFCEVCRRALQQRIDFYSR